MEYRYANLVRLFHKLHGRRCAKLKVAKFFLMQIWQIAQDLRQRFVQQDLLAPKMRSHSLCHVIA
jgi:hypothetical protein